jgi:hypothetical protein
MSLFQELKRRNVIRIAILYMVSSQVLACLVPTVTVIAADGVPGLILDRRPPDQKL